MVTRRTFLISLASVTAAGLSGAGCSAPPDDRSRPTASAEAPAAVAGVAPAAASPAPAPARAPLAFTESGETEQGTWQADVSISPSSWSPGDTVQVTATLRLPAGLAAAAAKARIKVEQACLLVTAERTFDADGWLRLPSDERMSTLLTPTRLAIEGGTQGAVTNRFGYRWRTPIDEYQTVPLPSQPKGGDWPAISFSVSAKLPADLPPGIYRVRLDFGALAGKRLISLNGDPFAQRPPAREKTADSHLYSPPIRASGSLPSAKQVDGGAIKPRIPWVILLGYNSNGYRGVVADEDAGRFALSERNLIHDDVILPLYDSQGKTLAYSLEPQFPADVIEARNNLPWDYAKGELSISVTAPDGKSTNLGTAPVAAKQAYGVTTKRPAFAAWKPSTYGSYTARVTGWIADRWGNRYEGGGTYHFWIAKRMTMATATFQGMAYPVGSRYGRDIGFSPAVPADVQVKVDLFVDSDASNVRSSTYGGKASAGGIFGAAQGMKPFTLDAPGEYHAQILAKYSDAEGHLWVCSMRHAGVVYPEDTPLVAHGKKLLVDKQLVDRGETHFEGYVEPGDDFRHLAHITFPYQAGDALLIASEQQGANKIEPVLTYELKGEQRPYDPGIQAIGASNLQIETTNGYSPHLFPEYISSWAYYYGAAPRPGFMSRFLVAEHGVRAPYWPTSPNNFGGQIGASNNGDLPGDIYRLLGGIVLRRQGSPPVYAGYIASAFILPKGSKNNRVIAPGSEELTGADGRRARFFLVGTRPGMAYEVGAAFTPAVQIDPILPASVRFTLRYPDGRERSVAGTGDRFGTFAGSERWTLDLPGVYTYTVTADWQGAAGVMPGLPEDGGQLFVYEARPAGASGLKVDLPNQSAFPVASGLTFNGKSSSTQVYYAAVAPGAVLAQGRLPVSGGRFTYRFEPAAVHQKIQTYDIVNAVNGKPEIGRIVHLTFFAPEVGADGKPYFDFARVILRGNQAIATR